MRRDLLACLLVTTLLLPLAAAGCSGQKTEEPAQVADQAAPSSDQAAPRSDQGRSAQEAVPAPPPRTRTRTEHRSTETIPEERPRRLAPEPPAEPATVSVTIPKGTALSLALTAPLSSATSAVGDQVTAELKNPVVVGDRVIFPAGSRIEGKVTDVKSAKKGFKDTGGALAVSFDRIMAPDGHSAGIVAGMTRVAEGSGKKKGAIIGGSALGAALLGRMLGKDTAGSAVVGGAVGTAVAAGTKGKEATISADQVMNVALEQPAQTTVKR